uniref:Delta-aminolevulinic acid dehydratase n=1 Tax=Paramoeba pemaquidensis TaxID=180228 RepID=A0A167HDE7_9EUKA|nr:delta-aminolevulinic acid dehydratase/porphobilinogen synthase [Paramoeba pemaquidensis]
MSAYQPGAQDCFHSAIAHPVTRKWQQENTSIEKHQLIYPLFIVIGKGVTQPIGSMPGINRYSVDTMIEHLKPLVALGLESVMLFGVVEEDLKDETGFFATSPNSPVIKAIKAIRKEFPTVLICADVCLCAYTTHHHCGILNDEGNISNSPSIARLAMMAVALGAAGCQVVAPSDMMDGRVGAIKQAIKEANLPHEVSVMSYSAKFASAYYGPFRDAAASGVQGGDRKCYQLPPAARGLAIRAIERDLREGADFIMVKPCTAYMDIVREAKERSHVPVCVYHVSGEFAMLHHAANAGVLSLRDGVMETFRCLRRAGADIIITYFTPQVLEWLSEKQ